MTQVAYGQKGYLGSSMSARAVEAYEQGEMPISRWTKTAIIQAIKDYCFDFDLAYNPDIEKKTKAELAKEFLEYKSWHHSSRTAREVEVLAEKFTAAKKTSLSSKSKRCVAMANTLDGASKGFSSRSETVR